MFQCNYCKRFLKEKYKNCPGCGSDSFSKVSSFTEQIIKTPPIGGYKVKVTNYKFQKKGLIVPIIIIVYILVFVLLFDSIFISTGVTLTGNDGQGFFGFMYILFGIFALITPIRIVYVIGKAARKENKSINNDIDKVKKLSQHGILIKNLPYELKMDKKSSYTKPVYRIKVLYEIEKGRTLSLESEPKYLTTLGRENGTVDLLIDPDDYSNYFIDFEIY